MKINGTPPQKPAVSGRRPEAPAAPQTLPKERTRMVDSFAPTPKASRTEALFHPGGAAPPVSATLLTSIGGPSNAATFGPPRPIPAGTLPSARANASPAEAAAYLEAMHFPTPMLEAEAFSALLSRHERDATWLGDFYGYLGAEKAAELMRQPIDAYSGNRPVDPAVLRGSLATLQQAGALRPADMDVLVRAWGANFDPALALMFAGRPGEDDDLKSLFVSSAVAYSTVGDSAPGASRLAAAAAYVLAASSPDRQLLVMRSIQQEGQLPLFIERATQGPMTALALESSGRVVTVDYDGTARLINSLSAASPRRWATRGSAPLSSEELTGLRTAVFTEAVKALGDEREALWAASSPFKDGLSRILMEDFDRLIPPLLNENNQASFRDTAVQDGMQGLFQNALFTPPLGAESRLLLDFMKDKLNGMVQRLGEEDYIANPDEMAFRDDTALAGLLAGTMMAGLKQADKAVEDSAAAMGNAVDLVLGFLPFDGLPGVWGTLIGGLSGHIGELTEEQLRRLVLERGPRLLIDRAVSALREELANQVEMQADFWAAYDRASRTPEERRRGGP